MPDLPDRPGGLRRIGVPGVGALAVLLVGLVALVALPGTASAVVPGPAMPIVAAPVADPCAAPADFTDQQSVIDTAVACLQAGGGHVAIIGDQRYSADQFADAIGRARSNHVDLWVVILGGEVGHDARADQDGASDVADGVRHVVGGTVVTVTPDYFGISSEQFSQSDLDRATDAVGGVGNDAEVVTKIVNSLTTKPFPWLLAVSMTIVVLVLGAFAGGLWTRHRRRHADAEALADLTAGLASRVGDMASTIVSITDEVDISGRPDIEDRFAQATSDYNQLRDQLATPLPDRDAVNKAATKVQALSDELAQISGELTAVLGHPPADPPARP